MVKIKNYLNNIAAIPFVWGQNDCYTLVYDLLNILYRDNALPNLRGQYHNKKEAAQLNQKYNWLKEFKKANFKIKYLSLKEQLKTGDLLIISHQGVECIHFYFIGKFWSILEEGSLISYPNYILRFMRDYLLLRLEPCVLGSNNFTD